MPGKMWFRDSDLGTPRSERARSKGQLTIILHAMTEDGWVMVRDIDGNPPVLGEWQQGEVHSCEMIFRAKKALGDYHENMNGKMFMMWINDRLEQVTV